MLRVVRNPFHSPLWRNAAFAPRLDARRRSRSSARSITRIALPLAAILVLGSGAVEVAVLRSLELGATLLVGLVAGAWVDRLRRRPVLIWADLGRAVLLASIPVAFALGVLTYWQLLVVSGLAAILTTFFDAADNAYLPTIVERERLVDANGALAASGSAAEFMAFGISGFLVQLLTAPIAIAIDALSFVASALLLGSIRRREAPPPPPEDREPVLDEIREGLRLVIHDPVLRAFAGAQMALAALWGVFGATWFLFVLDELGLGPAVLGVDRRGRWGLVVHRGGRRVAGHAALGHRPGGDRGDAPGGDRQRVHPARAGGPAGRRHRLPRHAAAGRRLGGDRLRHHRGLRPPDARPRPGARPGHLDVPCRGGARPARRDVVAGVLAEAIGLRATSWLAPLGGLARRGHPVGLAGPDAARPPGSRRRRRGTAAGAGRPCRGGRGRRSSSERDQPVGG